MLLLDSSIRRSGEKEQSFTSLRLGPTIMDRAAFGGGGGGMYPYENGVVMTRDPKPRLRWMADLHDRFVDVVTKLGHPEKATPKSILRLMGLKCWILYHLKSHLQVITDHLKSHLCSSSSH
ncbi:unnamed protein product [Linum tenue]|uniref:Uncharacterized protein n=1 Tax=Linum tenue TaxID=586396 RepID=A0AAV0NXC0_9ROSI|nr:unnamed protein product [Linum tenue]